MDRFVRRLRALAPVLLLALALMPSARPAVRAADAQAMLEASDGLANDGFGTAIALSGDTLAVGAPYATVGGVTFAGAVYLFRRDAQASTGWTELKRLTRQPPTASGQFGSTLALQNDTLVVGAEHETGSGGFQQGMVYVFTRDQGGADAWGLATTLKDDSLGALGQFGSGVAVDGELVVVGAEGAYDHRGAAYVYSRAANWGLLKQLADQDSRLSDLFGASVAVEGDTVVVGSERADHDPQDTDTGAAFVFERNQGGENAWGQVVRLEAPLTFANGAFGSSVAIDGDTLVVGSRFENRVVAGQVEAYSVGAAYVFERNQGGANAWGWTHAFHPADGAASDYTGANVAIQGDHVWISAQGSAAGGFAGQGRVYHLQRDEGGAGAWGALAPIDADNGSLGDRFGASLAASGTVLAAGAPARMSGRGAAYVVGADANTPALATSSAYLPLVLNEWYPPTGMLLDGASLTSPSGAIIGAVPGTLSAALGATIDLAAAPQAPLPAGITPIGPFYVAATQEATLAPADKPFLIGLPVPTGIDSAHLGAVVFVPGGFSSESDPSATPAGAWSTLPGSYDPASNLFVVTTRMLLPGGMKLALFVHPDNEPLEPLTPLASAASTRQAGAPVQFRSECDLTRLTIACTPANRRLLDAELADAYSVFVTSHGFNPPAMIHMLGVFVGADQRPTLTDTYYHALISTHPCTGSDGQLINGQYSFATLELLVCMNETATGDEIRPTVRHELFHAVQAAYPNVAADRTGPSSARTHWLIEGTAAAAERSSYILLRSLDFSLREASTPLTATAELNEYSAQDFWIYTGDQLGQPLSFLQPIFDAGATPEHVDQALTMPDAYWSWSKNQVIEHADAMNGAFIEGPCGLELRAFDVTNVPYIFFSTQRTAQGTLPPLTSAVVEIDFQRRAFYAQVLADNDGDSADLRYKVYKQNETGCEAVPDGQRTFQDLQNGDTLYVLLSNVSLHNDFTYVVQVLAE